ncbi:MAG TPA: class I SAM-dependent methyltransferase [Streptosporangiaceae bacterium]|nr:class I SAM-dependent methyltransferase [Streptosporangiaceae bacterium]
MSDAEARMQDHDAYDLIEDQFNRELDFSLGPAGPDSLFGFVAEMALPSGAVVVDAGCGDGEHAIELGTRYGFLVTGVDPVPRCVQAARRNAPPGSPVTFAAGTADQLPLPSGSADLIWCRDVLSLVEDLDAVYREFRRVLKPGGRAVIYQMFTTSLLESDEAAFLLPVMGCWASAMRPENTEAAITGAGLRIDRCVVLGSEWGEYYQEQHRPESGGHLLHAARLLRDPERYIARFGTQNYNIKLGDCLWHIYRMIGKLSSRVYLVSAPPNSAPGRATGNPDAVRTGARSRNRTACR